MLSLTLDLIFSEWKPFVVMLPFVNDVLFRGQQAGHLSFLLKLCSIGRPTHLPHSTLTGHLRSVNIVAGPTAQNLNAERLNGPVLHFCDRISLQFLRRDTHDNTHIAVQE